MLIGEIFDGDCFVCVEIFRWRLDCDCHDVSDVTAGVNAVAIDARKLIFSCTANCLSRFVRIVVVCEGKLNIDKDSFENSFGVVVCCWVSWTRASSIDDDVDDDVDDDDWRLAVVAMRFRNERMFGFCCQKYFDDRWRKMNSAWDERLVDR